jgi:hypothetical protein
VSRLTHHFSQAEQAFQLSGIPGASFLFGRTFDASRHWTAI